MQVVRLTCDEQSVKIEDSFIITKASFEKLEDKIKSIIEDRYLYIGKLDNKELINTLTCNYMKLCEDKNKAKEVLNNALEYIESSLENELNTIKEYLDKMKDYYSNIESVFGISVYGCGHYSNSEYSEEIILTQRTYNIIKSRVSELEEDTIYLGELDGKHSSVYGDIEVSEYTISDLTEDIECDGDRLARELETILTDYGLNYNLEQSYINEAVRNTDKIVEVTVNVLESKKEELLKLLRDNGYEV